MRAIRNLSWHLTRIGVRTPTNTSERVHWAANPRRSAVEDMGIDHRRLDVAMAQEFLPKKLMRRQPSSPEYNGPLEVGASTGPWSSSRPRLLTWCPLSGAALKRRTRNGARLPLRGRGSQAIDTGGGGRGHRAKSTAHRAETGGAWRRLRRQRTSAGGPSTGSLRRAIGPIRRSRPGWPR